MAQLSQLVLVLLMFCGACASTGGGVKCSRVLMLLRAIRREIHQIAHPRSVEVVKLDGKVAEESTVHSVLVFVGCYSLILLGGRPGGVVGQYALRCVLLRRAHLPEQCGAGPVCHRSHRELFRVLGPVQAGAVPCMIVGRLEIFPILVMFSARTWRRD